MDDDRYFYIVDRKKNMIITSSYNVYLRGIDEVFYMHPKVQEACAIGISEIHTVVSTIGLLIRYHCDKLVTE